MVSVFLGNKKGLFSLFVIHMSGPCFGGIERL